MSEHAGERSDPGMPSEHAGRGYRPCRSAVALPAPDGAQASAGSPSTAGERSDPGMQ